VPCKAIIYFVAESIIYSEKIDLKGFQGVLILLYSLPNRLNFIFLIKGKFSAELKTYKSEAGEGQGDP
jgi:hypothetical protein